jgi:DNA polymerase I
MKLLLVDGYSLLYRAFFSSPPLTTREGQPTGALYGFVRMLLRLLDEAQPEYALVALESHGPTFRHDSYADYKANRAATPDDLKIQSRLARDLLDGLSIPRYEHEGYEGDDVLGTLACIGAGKGLDVTIVTGDGDTLQLVNPKVTVMLTRRGVSDLECFTEEGVQARYGFAPALVPDFKGLRGDSSDNIPGVPGIGDKTGMSLVSKWGALESIYENLSQVTPPRIAKLLEEHREIAFQSRDLARIVTDLPIDFEFENCRYGNFTDEQRETALATVRLFEFKSLIARYASTQDAEPQETALQKSECETQGATNFDEVEKWLAQHANNSPVAFALREGGAVLGASGHALLFDGDVSTLKNWLSDESAKKAVHDAKSLKLALCKLGLEIRGVSDDVLLMGYLLDPTRQSHPLTLLAEKYLSRALPVPEAPKKPAKKTAKTSLFDDDVSTQDESPDESAAQNALAAASACAIFDLVPALRRALQGIGEEEIFDRIELPLVDVLVGMEQLGMLLDRAHLEKVSVQLEADATRLQSEIWQLAGEEFNIGSTKQLQVILFEKLGLAKGRATKTGYSTDVHTLERLAEEHEIVRKILEYRGTTKLKSTYVDALLAGMDASTHRIHTNLNQTGTVSGRISSSDPNLQNIPIRTEQGRLIRKAFVAPPGHVILAADYSQVELRILAHITGDEPLVEAFRSGQDVHSRTAADLFDVKVEDVDSEMRRKAKMTNYAIAYGVSGFGLAKQLGTGTAGEAQEFIKRYFEALPGVKNYIDDILKQARTDGHVKTLMGRRRPLPDINSPRQQERAAAERTAINHPIQGTSADIMKLAMLAVDRELSTRKLKARVTMQVHDELVFEVPLNEVDEVTEIAMKLMCEVPAKELNLRVPLEVEVGVADNWNDA